VGDEFGRGRQLFPDLRQEGGAAAAGAEDHAVDVRAQPGEGVGLVGKGHRFGGRQQRDLDADRRQFAGGDRREARVAQGGGQRVVADVLAERPPGFEAADAAAQLAVPGQRHEGGAGFVHPAVGDVDRGLSSGRDRDAGPRQQRITEIRHGQPREG
jgi:hypothetical protein